MIALTAARLSAHTAKCIGETGATVQSIPCFRYADNNGDTPLFIAGSLHTLASALYPEGGLTPVKSFLRRTCEAHDPTKPVQPTSRSHLRTVSLPSRTACITGEQPSHRRGHVSKSSSDVTDSRFLHCARSPVRITLSIACPMNLARAAFMFPSTLNAPTSVNSLMILGKPIRSACIKGVSDS